METKFKSQIYTTRFQSEKLLALGLKKETADMVHFFSRSLAQDWTIVPLAENETARQIQDNEIPAWSLHRLIEMMPKCIVGQGWLSVGHCGLHYSRGYGVADNGLYESIVRMYEWLIKEGYFNKEYLV